MDKIKRRKVFLILTKYIPHLIALMYIIYTLVDFTEIDMLPIGYMFNLSILPWIYLYSASFALEFCYVHRLPLYYILVDELLLISDYYLNIPISTCNLLILHLFVIGILIFGYTYYYFNKKKC